VLTIGLFLPALNMLSGTEMLGRPELVGVARLVLVLTATTAIAAAILRGLARLLEHGGQGGEPWK
jgi:hypothetical protein